MLIQLTSTAERPYGIENKYRDDDGGPSYWWRDKMIDELIANHGESSLPPGIQQKLQSLFATSSLTSDQLMRLYRFLGSRKSADLTNWNELIDDFARKEGRRSKVATILRRGVPTAATLAVGALLSFVVIPWSGWHVAAAVVSVVLVPCAVLIAISRKPDYLDAPKLLALRRDHAGDF